MWVSGFVLLIACANLANLMLVRSANRQQQTSVRSALGAPRMTLVRQTLTESIVLAVLGGIAGIAVAFAGTRVILFLAFQKEPVPIPASPSLPVLGFALAGFVADGGSFWGWPGMVDVQGKSGRGATRRESLDGEPWRMGTEIAGGVAGGSLRWSCFVPLVCWRGA